MFSAWNKVYYKLVVSYRMVLEGTERWPHIHNTTLRNWSPCTEDIYRSGTSFRICVGRMTRRDYKAMGKRVLLLCNISGYTYVSHIAVSTVEKNIYLKSTRRKFLKDIYPGAFFLASCIVRVGGQFLTGQFFIHVTTTTSYDSCEWTGWAVTFVALVVTCMTKTWLATF